MPVLFCSVFLLLHLTSDWTDTLFRVIRSGRGEKGKWSFSKLFADDQS